MSWKNIKTFLILLFLIINVYLIVSTRGILFKKQGMTYFNKNTVLDTAKVIKNNYNVILPNDVVPTKIPNLRNIDVTNIIYTDAFKKSGYEFKINGASFILSVKTNTFSYNEQNAETEFKKITASLGIMDNSYQLEIYKSDKGLICEANQRISDYTLFNGQIKAIFTSNKIQINGIWYITDLYDEETLSGTSKMTDISGILIDVAASCGNSTQKGVILESVEYGYYVTSYDKNAVSKSSSAIPCYMVKTDDGLKYYYDASNGKAIKQED